MIRIRLAEEDAQGLERAYREETDPRFRDRIQIVRLASHDRPHKGIAQDLAISTRTVQRWLNAYLDGGLDGLRPRKAPGKPGNIPAGLADEVKRWVIEGPSKQGLDRANWTHGEIADHLLKARGSGPPEAPCSASARRSASASTAPLTTTSAATPRSRPRPART